MKKRVGLIDFGSNTFHLIIAEITTSQWQVIFHQRDYVFLAQTGITHIADEAMNRGLKAVKNFHSICTQHQVDEILAVGTAALRTADNSNEFTSMIRQEYGIHTRVIDGEKEANYIYQGMGIACPDFKKNALFMDIGGGSTEFIITHSDKKVFQVSLPIGLGVLKNAIPFSDPVTREEIHQFNEFLDKHAAIIPLAIHEQAPKTLIGGSGTFDVLAEALTGEVFDAANCSSIEPGQVRRYITDRLYTTTNERLEDPSIPDKRVPLIIHAFLLIIWLMDHHQFQQVAFSKYALKEGFIQEYYEQWLKEQ